MRIWIASELYYPEEASTGYLMTKIAEELATASEVHVICGPAAYQSDVLKASYSIRSDIRIYRVFVPHLDKGKMISRILRMILLTFSMGLTLVARVRKGDKVVIVTNPPSLLVFVSILRKIIGFHYSIIVHDVFPENLVPAGILKNKSFLYKIFLSVFNFSYNAADKLIVLGRDMEILVTAKIKKEIPVKVIQNWADTNDIYPLVNFSMKDYYPDDLTGKIILQFAGNIGRVQGLDLFFTLFRKVNNPELVIIIIGEGALKNELISLQKSAGLSNIYFYPAKARSEQLAFLNACHIGLITVASGMFGLGVPSKIYNIMAAGKPILYIGDGETEPVSYINENNIGWAFNWNDEDKCVDFLARLQFNDIEMIEQKGRNARELAELRFTKKNILSKYKEALV